MKKEIINLLNSENAILTLNQFCHLHRWQIDALGNPCDRLAAVFNLTSSSSHRYEIGARDWRSIIEEVAEFQSIAFAAASEELNKQLLNGYIG